jgi:hypothetical protein
MTHDPRDIALHTGGLDRAVGALVRAWAEFDQGLFRALRSMRTGDYLKQTVAGGLAKAVRDDAKLPDTKLTTRRDLALELIDKVLSDEKLRAAFKSLVDQSDGPNEIRDIVCHWSMVAISHTEIRAQSFAATETEAKRAATLLKKYRSPQPAVFERMGIEADTVTITLAQIEAATAEVHRLRVEIQGIATAVEIDYAKLLRQPINKES